MKKLKVGIYGVAIFMFICLLTNGFDVYAASCNKSLDEFKKYYENTCTWNNIASYYKVTMLWKDDDEYTILLKGKNVNKNDQFKVVEISSGKLADGQTIDSLPVIKRNKSLTIKIDPGKNGDDDYVSVKVQLIKSKKFNDCLNTSPCDIKHGYTNGTPYTVELTASSGQPLINGSSLDEKTKINYSNEISKEITEAKNSRLNSTYGSLIEEIKNNSNTKKIKQSNATDKKNLYCNPNINSETVTNSNTLLGNNKDKYYSSNTKYFYVEGKTPTKQIKATLTYNYSPTNYKTETVPICDITCDEAVKVEYGPPVASMAGLCFEYSVKITSYVRCGAKNVNAKFDTSKYDYCTPNPVCNSTEDYYDQAGPTQEFDECIKTCDGGKYSRKCSNSCYKKVYGNSASSTKLTLLSNYENNVVKLRAKSGIVNRDYTDCADKDGCYYFSGDTILWKSKGKFANSGLSCGNVRDTKGMMPGRYYLEKLNVTGNGCPNNTSTSNYYYIDYNGIYVANYKSGTTCGNDCKWTGCSKSSYMNPAQARADADSNKKAIVAALKSCKAAATCSTRTNTVTIKTNFATYSEISNTGSNVQSKKDENYSECKTNYNYTASFGEFSLPSNGYDTNKSEKSFSDDDKIVLSRDACYVKGNTDSEKYLTEWGFPGTFLNVKHGDVKYDSSTDDENGYVYKDKNFCLPLNIASVNTKWWKQFVENQSVTGYDSDGDNTRKGIIYNILATSRDFGYYGWNFDINCFFGVSNGVLGSSSSASSNSNTSSSNNSNKCDSTSTYDKSSFRVVDLSSTDTLFANRKNIGFNWTSAATAKKLGGGYNTSPSKIAEQVTKNNELDYQFNLNKSNLAKIKQYTKSKKDGNYSKYNGNLTLSDNKSVIYYTSPLVTDIGTRSKNILGVNNIYTK